MIIVILILKTDDDREREKSVKTQRDGHRYIIIYIT
jgi:hypothetical protein